MRKKFLIIIVSIFFFFSGCGIKDSKEVINKKTELYSETYIKQELEKNNYCKTKNDCAHVKSKCPFGCNVYVNKTEKEKIQVLLDGFSSNCIYKCMQCDTVKCENNKCITNCSS